LHFFNGTSACAIRLADFPTIGMAGGNIIESGTRALCDAYGETLGDVLNVIG
jgi:beta-phosphoglucomutase